MKVTCQQICILTSKKKNQKLIMNLLFLKTNPQLYIVGIFLNQCLTQNPTPTKDPSRDFFFLIVISTTLLPKSALASSWKPTHHLLDGDDAVSLFSYLFSSKDVHYALITLPPQGWPFLKKNSERLGGGTIFTLKKSH